MVQILLSGTQTSPRMLLMWRAPLQPHVSTGQTHTTLMTYMYTLFYTYKYNQLMSYTRFNLMDSNF